MTTLQISDVPADAKHAIFHAVELNKVQMAFVLLGLVDLKRQHPEILLNREPGMRQSWEPYQRQAMQTVLTNLDVYSEIVEEIYQEESQRHAEGRVQKLLQTIFGPNVQIEGWRLERSVNGGEPEIFEGGKHVCENCVGQGGEQGATEEAPQTQSLTEDVLQTRATEAAQEPTPALTEGPTPSFDLEAQADNVAAPAKHPCGGQY